MLLTAGRKFAEKMAIQINQDLATIGIKINLHFLSFNTKVNNKDIHLRSCVTFVLRIMLILKYMNG